MLLAFAQFEREVTAERIRDKIAASKAKGMWMGGIVPIGYRWRRAGCCRSPRRPRWCGGSSSVTWRSAR